MNKRRQRLKAQIGLFMQQYARKHAHYDPNDRKYSRKIEKIIRKMTPQELDDLMHGIDEGDD